MILYHTALSLEAKTFIKKLGLKKDLNFKQFEFFENDNTALIVSGIGKIQTATALGAALAYLQTQGINLEEVVLINAGTCGAHESIKLEELVYPVKISTLSVDTCFYPEILLKDKLKHVTLVTSVKPLSKENYNIEEDSVVDMEGFAVFKAAYCFLGTHQVHSLKIVSDHLDPKAFSKEKITQYFENNIDAIIEFATSIEENILKQEVLDEEDRARITNISNRFDLTKAQELILQEKVRQLRVMKNQAVDDYFNVELEENLDRQKSKQIFNECIRKIEAILC